MRDESEGRRGRLSEDFPAARGAEVGGGRAGGARGRGEVRCGPRAGRDVDDCVRVLAAVHERDGYPVNWPADPRAWLTPPELIGAWTARLDGRVAGHVVLSRSADGDVAPGLWGSRSGAHEAAAAVVGRLFVAPRARGHGVGALLVERATAEARRRGLHPVLDVVSTDTAAVALYERLGWELLAEPLVQHWSPRQSVTVRCYAAPS